MLFMFFLARASEAFLFQHAVIITIPGHFLASWCYSWFASWMHVFMYSRNKGRAHTFVTLLDKFEQTEVETRASFVPVKVLEFSSCSFSSCLSAAASGAYPGTWTHQAVARLLQGIFFSPVVPFHLTKGQSLILHRLCDSKWIFLMFL